MNLEVQGKRGFALWAALVIPSLYVVDKYSGRVGAFSYATAAAVAVAVFPRLSRPLTGRQTFWLAIAAFAVLVVAFAFVYPRVNVHVPGLGSDDDDAYNVGARALMTLRSPYAERTYLGNVLHQLPGAFILAVPFVLLGTSALQNLFWLPLFFLVARREFRDEGEALKLAWLVLVCSPTVLHEVVTGTGHVANTIYVTLGLWWLTRTRHLDLAAAAWGVALASRANFLFLLPLAYGWLRRRHGVAAAARAIALAGVVAAGLSLPFYLSGPHDFGPLEAANRLTQFDTIVPFAGAAILSTMAVMAVVLSTRSTEGRLFWDCALLQAFPVAVGTLLESWYGGWSLAVAFASYGSFFSWFVFAALLDPMDAGGGTRRFQKRNVGSMTIVSVESP